MVVSKMAHHKFHPVTTSNLNPVPAAFVPPAPIQTTRVRPVEDLPARVLPSYVQPASVLPAKEQVEAPSTGDVQLVHQDAHESDNEVRSEQVTARVYRRRRRRRLRSERREKRRLRRERLLRRREKKLNPLPLSKYLSAPRNGSITMLRSMRKDMVPSLSWRRYELIIKRLHPVRVLPGISGVGLFVPEDVYCGRRILEYVGNRIEMKSADDVERVFHKQGKSVDIFADVPSEGTVIDPRGCGNHAQYINHSCSPNARLLEWEVPNTDLVLVFIVAIKKVIAHSEVLIDYSFSSIRTKDILMCDCKVKNCRLYV